jgi:hypothetical protein
LHLLSTAAIESKKGKFNMKKDGAKYCCYKEIKNPNFEGTLFFDISQNIRISKRRSTVFFPLLVFL